MGHVFEEAPSGRAKCRGCGKKIDKGVLRFGERMPNMFGEGEMTLWFHPVCASYKRPEAMIEALDLLATSEPDESVDPGWRTKAEFGVEHSRLPRLSGAERAPSGRARCRHCRELIEKSSWRLALVFYQEGMFEPSGSIHISCASDYFETVELMDRIEWFSDLTDTDLEEIRLLVESGSKTE